MLFMVGEAVLETQEVAQEHLGLMALQAYAVQEQEGAPAELVAMVLRGVEELLTITANMQDRVPVVHLLDFFTAAAVAAVAVDIIIRYSDSKAPVEAEVVVAEAAVETLVTPETPVMPLASRNTIARPSQETTQ